MVTGSNMKKALKITWIFSGLLLIFSFANPEKKIEKLVSKIWKNKEITLNQLSLPDTLSLDVSQLNEIIEDDVLLGYACYTTALGCRIGGCAAPSNPNVQNYESFDYIVIYDADMSIIKIDIANYGGQYGYEICRPKWLSQFIGKTNGFKLNENIDGISGATVSASHLIDDLNIIGGQLRELQSLSLL